MVQGQLISELKEKKIIDGKELIPTESENQNYYIDVNNLWIYSLSTSCSPIQSVSDEE